MLIALTDEILKRAGIDPSKQLDRLAEAQQRKLVKVCAEHNCYIPTNHGNERFHERGITAKQWVSCMKLGTLTERVPGNRAGEIKMTLRWLDPKDGKNVYVHAVVVLGNVTGPALIVTSYFDGNNLRR
jgi:hypothetical protein